MEIIRHLILDKNKQAHLGTFKFQFVQQHPTVATNSPEFRSLGLSDEESKQLAYQIIESYPFLGQSTKVYNSKGAPCQTIPVRSSPSRT